MDVLRNTGSLLPATQAASVSYDPVARGAVALIPIAGLLWYFAGGFALILIAGLLWFFVGLERTLRGTGLFLDRLIKKSVVPRALIAGKLRNFVSLARNRFAGYMPTSLPIKRVAVGLILTAGVLWFFAGMVKKHFAAASFDGRQPVLAATQQANTKQKSFQDATPQPDTGSDAVVDISAEQVDHTGDSLLMDESVKSGDLTIESNQLPDQPISDQSVAIESPRIHDSVAENEKPPSPPIPSAQGGGSQVLPPEQGVGLGGEPLPITKLSIVLAVTMVLRSTHRVGGLGLLSRPLRLNLFIPWDLQMTREY